jgi:hypothetical protein
MAADASWQTAWLRRVTPGGMFRRRRYELEVMMSTGERLRRVTSAPLTYLDPHLGVGDAWAVIHAADAKWSGDVGDWVTLAPNPDIEPPAP